MTLFRIESSDSQKRRLSVANAYELSNIGVNIKVVNAPIQRYSAVGTIFTFRVIELFR